MSRKRDEYETNYNENRRLEPVTKKLRSPVGSDHQSDIHDSNGTTIAFERKSSAGTLPMDANGLVSSGILKPAQVHDRTSDAFVDFYQRSRRFPFRIRCPTLIYSNDLFCLFSLTSQHRWCFPTENGDPVIPKRLSLAANPRPRAHQPPSSDNFQREPISPASVNISVRSLSLRMSESSIWVSYARMVERSFSYYGENVLRVKCFLSLRPLSLSLSLDSTGEGVESKQRQTPIMAFNVSISVLVCSDLAHGYNFDAISCESCKAFFRRNALFNTVSSCLPRPRRRRTIGSFLCSGAAEMSA